VSPEHEQELDWLVAKLKEDGNVHKVLEIGSRVGISLQKWASILQPGDHIVAVDLPKTNHLGAVQSAELARVCKELQDKGLKVDLILSDSTDPGTVEAIRKLGPFDFCYIDGGHWYEVVLSDWKNYGPMARIVAFDDINAQPPYAVHPVWEQIRLAPLATCDQFIAGAGHQGTGIVYNEP